MSRQRTRLARLAALLAPFGLTILAAGAAAGEVSPPGPPGQATVLPGVPGRWVRIEPGTFHRGSPPGEAGRFPDEVLHQVTLTRPVLMLTTEVTQADFEAVMGYDPARFPACGPLCPVEGTSWHEAAAYGNALSDRAGLRRCYDCIGAGPSVVCDLDRSLASPYDCPGFRLPTDAEFERAARAGTVTGTYKGELDPARLGNEQSPLLDQIAWFGGNSGDTPHPVATKQPNQWGLYDMLGNLWEWCHDWYGPYPSAPVTDPFGPGAGAGRTRRGGSWGNPASTTRAASRYWHDPADHDSAVGFRLVRTAT